MRGPWTYLRVGTTLLTALLHAATAFAQGAIQQSGAVVPFHAGAFYQNGVMGDAGSPSAPALSALGLFGGANCPFGVSSQTGPGTSLTPGGLFTICQTATATTLNVAGVNGQATPTFSVNIGGASYPFPYPAPPTTPLTATCDGVTDNAAGLNQQLAALAIGIAGTAVLPAGTCVIKSTITVPSNVILSGRGPAINWAAIGPSTSVNYPTRLLWGGASTGVMISTPALSVGSDLGVQNLTIDGGVISSLLGSSGLKGIYVSSSLGFVGRNLDFQNIGTGISFEPNFTLSSPNNLVSWGHYENIHEVNVGYCARFGPNAVGHMAGGVTNNFFYDIVCYSYYNTGLDFVALSDDNRFTGAYLLSGVASSKAIVFNSGTPSVANGVYANDFFNAELDDSDTTGSQSSLVVNNTGGFSSVFQGIVANEGTHYDPIQVNAGGNLYNWDVANPNGPIYYSASANPYGLTVENSSSAGASTFTLGNDAQGGLGQLTANGSANVTLGGGNSVNLVNSTANPVDLWSDGVLAGLFGHNGSQILGTTTNDNAPAGYYGEDVLSDVLSGSAVPLTTTVSANVTHITLSAGDWTICGNVWTASAGGTVTTLVIGGISTTSGVLPTAPGGGAIAQWSGTTTGQAIGLSTGCVRAQPTASTNYYLIANASFATSTLAAFGHIEARRER